MTLIRLLFAGFGCALILSTCSGCSWMQSQIARRNGTAPFKQVAIAYQLPHPHQALFEEQSEVPTDKDLADEQLVSATESRWTSATLRVQYPHPEGHAEMARCQLRLGKQSAIQTVMHRVNQNPFGNANFGNRKSPIQLVGHDTSDEIWVMDLPVSELRDVLSKLTTSGYFDEQTRPGTGVELAVAINSEKTEKEWTAEPGLDSLIAQVYQEGWLCTFCNANEPVPTSSGM